jgi:hypothetical protein
VSKKTLKNSYESLSVESKLLFLAGIFDGEGSFGIWSKGKGRKKEFACTIEMTDKDTLLKFVDMFGGQLFSCKVRKEMIEFMSQRRQEKYYVVKRDKISGTSRYAHIQEASRD